MPPILEMAAVPKTGSSNTMSLCGTTRNTLVSAREAGARTTRTATMPANSRHCGNAECVTDHIPIVSIVAQHNHVSAARCNGQLPARTAPCCSEALRTRREGTTRMQRPSHAPPAAAQSSLAGYIEEQPWATDMAFTAAAELRTSGRLSRTEAGLALVG